MVSYDYIICNLMYFHEIFMRTQKYTQSTAERGEVKLQNGKMRNQEELKITNAHHRILYI